MDLNLSPYNFVIFTGTAKKSGKPYRVASLDKDVSFNDTFIDRLIAGGSKVIEAERLPKQK